MDKSILKKFAIESRKDLMEKIKNKINTYYIDEEFKKEQKGEIYVLSNEKHLLSLTNEEYQKRELLIKRIKELSLEQVIEEAAYTWFNRIIAIRYMEINDYLPLTKDNQSLGIRVLSSKDNTPDPEILKFTNLVNPDLDIDFKKEKYVELKDENEKFKYVLLLVCKKLGRVIPQVFDGITDYIDILIPDNLLNDTGFITKVINEVPEENYNQVEIIGWLYQYYNQTEKDRVMSDKKKYTKTEIAYVTQLFTPDWIVKYLVENSLGRFWIENGGDKKLIELWHYFLNSEIEIKNINIDPKSILCIDPCMGSGHILVYMFEILYQIYLSCGYAKTEIVKNIFLYNINGIDIDDRACQLSILSLILKAREFDNQIFNYDIIENMNIVSIKEVSENIENFSYYLNDNEKAIVEKLIKSFNNSKEIGSLLKIDDNDYLDIRRKIEEEQSIFSIEAKNQILPLIKIANILNKKYNIYVTNPPYLNADSMNNNIKKYLSKHYPDFKQDLYAAFMGLDIVKENGYIAMITQQGWMFLTTFEKTRKEFCKRYNIVSLLHLGSRTFEEISGEVVQNSSFIAKKTSNKSQGYFYRLIDFKNPVLKEKKYLESLKTKENLFILNANFDMIPGSPISYWVDNNIKNIFNSSQLLGNIIPVKKGMDTGDNNRFLRMWYEVDFKKTVMYKNDCSSKWICYNKGGPYQKWYGNNYYVVNWENNGYELRQSSANLRSENLYFKPSITWTALGNCTFRYSYPLSIFDSSGSSMFPNDKNLYGILAFCNSNIMNMFLDILNPTLSSGAGTISKLPIIEGCLYNTRLMNLSKENVKIVKKYWDFNEYSWDFNFYSNIPISSSLKKYFKLFKQEEENDRKQLKNNEEEINNYFKNVYKLENCTVSVEDRNISIKRTTEKKFILNLISYAVGCMFGRYSLDKEGLIYAGGNFDKIYKKYKESDGGWAGVSLSNYKVLNDNGQEIDLSFEVDNDNIIPITDEAYFGDDIVERFKTFISVVYGEKTLNENLDFIAETLGKRGTETSEDTIRRYFVNDFFNDHVKTYQKRPIYWLFDSGKKNGFKALVYMHRYNENLIPKVRLDYLHRMQTTYEKLLTDVNDKLTAELSMTEKKEAQKRQVDLNAKLQEIREYDEKIAHIANQRISIDLDDGVKVNYDKFKDILTKIK